MPPAWSVTFETWTSTRSARVQRDERERSNDVESTVFDGTLRRASDRLEIDDVGSSQRRAPGDDGGDTVT